MQKENNHPQRAQVKAYTDSICWLHLPRPSVTDHSRRRTQNEKKQSYLCRRTGDREHGRNDYGPRPEDQKTPRLAGFEAQDQKRHGVEKLQIISCEPCAIVVTMSTHQAFHLGLLFAPPLTMLCPSVPMYTYMCYHSGSQRAPSVSATSPAS